MFTTRGCPVGCKFCQTPVFCNKPNIISLESIEGAGLLQRAEGINVVLIEDENFGCNQHADQVVELLDKYEMVWGCMARADYLRKKINDWADMKKNGRKVAGFGGAAIGIENLHQERLDDMKKKEGTEDILETLRMLQERGLGTVGYYMIGFEEDSKESLREDIKEKLAALKLDITQICVILPLPQTPMWTEIEEKFMASGIMIIITTTASTWFGIILRSGRRSSQKFLDWSLKQVYPWSTPLRTSGRVWSNAYRYGGWAGVKEVFAYISRANKFDWNAGPRLLKVSGN